MSNPVIVCNLGIVSKLGATAIRTLTPPRSSVEIHCSVNYPRWKRQELARRRWTFATEFVQLTLGGQLTSGPGVDERVLVRPYWFLIPPEVLRPIPQRDTRWARRGDRLYADSQTLTIEAIVDKPEDKFDPLFEDVLACRVAMECGEPITQSNVKKETVRQWYKDAVAEAARMNAFQLEPESHEADDSSYSWLVAREGYAP